MRALVLDADGPRFVTNHPFTPRSGEATVDVRLAGVCATDLELVKGYMGFSGVLGHEWVGTVSAGPDDWLGARVVGDINAACGVCETCLAGRPSHCPHRTVLGIQGRDGAFAEQLSLPVTNLHRVPDEVSDEAAVFVEPLAAACQILEQVHVRPSHRVVVLGLGRLGQLCARVLALTGARVLGVSRSAPPLSLLPRSVPGVRAADVSPDGQADIVVDCTGSSAGMAAAMRWLRPRGTLVLKTTTHDLGEASPTAWVIDELTVVGSRCGPFEPALRLLATGLVDPTPLIHAARPLSEGVDALEQAAQPGVLKVVLRP